MSAQVSEEEYTSDTL